MPNITTISFPGGTVPPATLIQDQATVSEIDGVPISEGDIVFFLCGPSEVVPGLGCPQLLGQQIGPPVPLTTSGVAVSQGVPAPSIAGRYCWRVEYSGGPRFAPAVHTDDAFECFNVQPVTPPTTFSMDTEAQPAGTITGPVTDATDRAILSGNVGIPTGTVQFFLCYPVEVGPSGCVAPAGKLVGGPVPLVDGSASSVPTALLAGPGTYCWRAEYSGNAQYAAASHTNATTECTTLVAQVIDGIDTTLDPASDLQVDESGIAFLEVTSGDGAITLRLRDLPDGVGPLTIRFRQLDTADLDPRLGQLDRDLVAQALALAFAGDISITDADGVKIPLTLDIILAPLDVIDIQFLLWLIEDPGGLTPTEFTRLPDGSLMTTVDFDILIIILEMPAPDQALRQGLNAIVYTGPRLPADQAFPGGVGRGEGVEALWRFTGFGYEAFFPAVPQIANPVYRLYDPLFVTASSATAVMQQALLLPVRRTIALTGGSNFVSYTGAGGSLVDELGPGVLARAQSIWVWRDLVGRWRGFFPGSPAFLQEATDLALGDLVFLSMDTGVGWDMR
ncbi:MAG: Ig-like domain-containing protein [Chloroflexi bacterium]|nr:Ig-like domain-containing protein [Chloroflexota bacterium]